MQLETKQHEYFPNLDGLRFIGSLAIILIHVEGIKNKQGKEIIPWVNYFFEEGGQAVSLFFVLSGFLITYLLLKEKQNTTQINLKKFYVRRILKIWPLYYFIGLIGFIVMPYFDQYFHGKYSTFIHASFWPSFICYFLFIPPLVPSQSIGAAWSVRVEEAFYLVWPLLLRNVKNYFKTLILIVVAVVVLRNVSAFLSHMQPVRLLKILDHQSKDYRVSCMAIGGMGAYLYLSGNRNILDILYKRSVQWAVYLTTIVFLLFKIRIHYINFEVYATLFSCIVLNLATNPESVVKLDYGWMNYLGKISYGLYLYNGIMRILCLEAVEWIYGRDLAGWDMNLTLYVLTITSTVLVSILSFELFEKRFLKLKRYFV